MLASQKLAIAAHLHVLLRRKTGRVTDTEWMAANVDYALEIVRFCRAKAAEDGHVDLGEWAAKLEQAVMSQRPAARPLAASALQLLREAAPAAPPVSAPRPAGAESGFAESSMFGNDKPPKPDIPAAPRYVGGIR